MTVLNSFVSLLSSLPIVMILFVIFFLVYWVNAFILVYHLVRFGVGPNPKAIALVFFLGAMVLFMVTILYFSRVDFTGIFSQLTNNLPYK